ncbi:TauD-domain-containing protein [Mycena floridula]|nr:TauD-domain-containing protein [Mycena floridula]
MSAPISYDINIPYVLTDKERVAAEAKTHFPEYLPSWDPIWFPPLPPFEFKDPALRADPLKPALLHAGVRIEHITPRMGSILHGVQIDQLSDAAKDELALFVCERKVVAFPDQNFMDIGPEKQQEFMKYFGKPNYQPVSGSIKGWPGFHVIHRDGNKTEIERFFSKKTTSTLWHQDVSYERQPPGYVALGLLDGPEVGGDTIFAATDEAFLRLSPAFRSKLEDIKVTHSSDNMIAHTLLAKGLVRKDPVSNIHPLIRVHPITKKKCIFLNGEFVTGFEGMKDVEFKMIQEFLLRLIQEGHDFQARVRWAPRTLVMFDNRSTLHTACVDYIDDDGNAQPRHIFRLAAMAEAPVPC